LFGRDLHKEVTREKRLVKKHHFAAIFVRGAVARQARMKPFPLAILPQLFFATRTGVDAIPKELTHAQQVVYAPCRVKPGRVEAAVYLLLAA
jgi:hypothetical protein